MQCRCTISLFEQYCVPWALPFTKEELRKILFSMVGALETQNYRMPKELLLYLVDDKTIAWANATFMKCTGPTNILSFPGIQDLSGTLLLSVKTFLRECCLYGQEQPEYLLRLLAHGLCHVAGLDHGKRMDELSGHLQQIAHQELADGIL